MINVTDESFIEIIGNSKYVLADFNAKWCGPCKALHPVLERIEKDYKDKITFISVDVEDCADAAENYRIMSVPTMICFKDGEPVSGLKMVGSMPETKIREKLEALMAE